MNMGPRGLLRWVEDNSVLLGNASTLLGSAGVNAILGFLFWWMAARLFPPRDVGLGTAAITVMSTTGLVSMLGFGTLLVGELSGDRDFNRRSIGQALALTGVVGLLLGLAIARLAPYFRPEMRVFASPAYSGLFALGVCIWAVSGVVDQVFIGQLNGSRQLVRNAAFASTKLLFLPALAMLFRSHSALDIYASWVIAGILSIAIALRPRDVGWGPSSKEAGRSPPFVGLLRKAIQHHMLNLSLQAPGLVLPLVVVATLPVAQNAYFYTAWMTAGFVFVIPFALSLTLYAAGSRSAVELTARLRTSLLASFVLVALANVLAQTAGARVLLLFGPEYAANASLALRVFCVAGLLVVIKDHYVALKRVTNEIGRASAVSVLGAMVEVTLSTIGAMLYGLVGLALGWATASLAEALVMLGTVNKAASGQLAPLAKSGEESL